MMSKGRYVKGDFSSNEVRNAWTKFCRSIQGTVSTVSLGYDRITDDGEGKEIVLYTIVDRKFKSANKMISKYKLNEDTMTSELVDQELLEDLITDKLKADIYRTWQSRFFGVTVIPSIMDTLNNSIEGQTTVYGMIINKVGTKYTLIGATGYFYIYEGDTLLKEFEADHSSK